MPKWKLDYSTPMVNIWDRNDRPIQSHTCSDRFLHGETSWHHPQKTGDWNLQHDSQKTFCFFLKTGTIPHLWETVLFKIMAKRSIALRNLFWLMRKFQRIANPGCQTPFYSNLSNMGPSAYLRRDSWGNWCIRGGLIPLGPRWMPCQILISVFFRTGKNCPSENDFFYLL